VILVVVYMRRRNDKRMKYFLLIAGDNYYPSGDTGDWIECYETYEEALNTITEIPKNGRMVNIKSMIEYMTGIIL